MPPQDFTHSISSPSNHFPHLIPPLFPWIPPDTDLITTILHSKSYSELSVAVVSPFSLNISPSTGTSQSSTQNPLRTTPAMTCLLQKSTVPSLALSYLTSSPVFFLFVSMIWQCLIFPHSPVVYSLSVGGREGRVLDALPSSTCPCYTISASTMPLANNSGPTFSPYLPSTSLFDTATWLPHNPKQILDYLQDPNPCQTF